MRIAIMGVGGVGGPFGAALAAAGHDVTFIARGEHLEAIQRDGLHVVGTRTISVDPARATDDPASVEPVDVVLFTVKLWDVEQAGAAIRPLLRPDTAVIALQNGVDAEERLSGVLGSGHVMGGVAEISATIEAPGRIRLFSDYARLKFGELDASDSARGQAFLNACRDADIEAYFMDDIQKALWEKFIMLAPVSGLTAVTRATFGDIRTDPDIRPHLVAAIEEAVAVGRAKGVNLDADVVDTILSFVDVLPADGTASMAIDLQRGNRLELPWLSGAVARLGRELDVPTPVHSFIYAALKLHQDGTRQ